MLFRSPNPLIVLLMSLSAIAFLGLAAWGWGGWNALMENQARAAGCAIVVVATIASCFTEINVGGFQRAGPKVKWIIAPIILFTFVFAGLPAYDDRRDLLTLDGDTMRYLGVVLLMVGCVLRVGPMFVLGRRFTYPLASQEKHRLETTGFYRYIRHPSYLGAFLGGLGWVLVFRSGMGVILISLVLSAIFWVIPAEERRLQEDFGEEYVAYAKRTWRLLPFLY